jgi:hypothetical protein
METLPPTSYFFHLAASFFMLMKLLTFDTTPKKHHPLPCYHRFFPPKAVFFSDEVLKKTLYSISRKYKIQIEVKKTRLGAIRASNPGKMKKISKKAITFYRNAS